MSCRARRAAVVVAVLLLYVLVIADPALAAGTAQFGRNLGAQVKGVAVALFLAVAGLVALPVLARRDVNGGVVLVILAVVLGGFVFAPGQVTQVVTDLWRSLTS